MTVRSAANTLALAVLLAAGGGAVAQAQEVYHAPVVAEFAPAASASPAPPAEASSHLTIHVAPPASPEPAQTQPRAVRRAVSPAAARTTLTAARERVLAARARLDDTLAVLDQQIAARTPRRRAETPRYADNGRYAVRGRDRNRVDLDLSDADVARIVHTALHSVRVELTPERLHALAQDARLQAAVGMEAATAARAALKAVEPQLHALTRELSRSAIEGGTDDR